MPRTVLHILSQRPGRTGSGVTLDSIVRQASEAGWTQHVVVGTPKEDAAPPVGDLAPDQIHPLVFGTGALPLELPGMSDVMPYPSRRFSSLGPAEIDLYLAAWRDHVVEVIDRVRPDVIHSHHIWLLSSILKDLAPGIPVVTHCHGTGFRQMELCPDLADRVRRDCARNEAFFVLHREHARRLIEVLGVRADCVRAVGAGYREDLFHDRGREAEVGPSLVYAGKFSRSKGLPSLLDAVQRLIPDHPDLRLHVAGDGSGEEAEILRTRMAGMEPHVRMRGMLSQAELGDLFRKGKVFALPSMYEGLPLVLVEAAACGCRVVCTRLPGVVGELADALGSAMRLVPLPPMRSIDEAETEGLPRFAGELAVALLESLSEPAPSHASDLDRFTWPSVFRRVERTWEDLMG